MGTLGVRPGEQEQTSGKEAASNQLASAWGRRGPRGL